MQSDATKLLEISEKHSQINVLVVGDIMLDRFIYGEVDRISPESPVPVLSVRREDTMLGGAGNALANLVGLGANAAIIALVGDDDEGRVIEESAASIGLQDDQIGLIFDEKRPTTIKTRYLAGHQQLLRTDFEEKAAICDVVIQKLQNQLAIHMKNADVVIISDYGKGLLRNDAIQHIIESAKANNVPVIVDPKGQDFSKYKGAFAVTPNKKELAESTNGMPTLTNEDIENAANKIIEECGIEAVIATRGSDGISVIQKGKAPVHIPTVDVEVYDVSGAGDTVIATIAASIAAGADLTQAASLANIAGGVVVAKVGTAAIRHDELITAIAGSSPNGLKTWEDTLEIVKRWRAKGRKIGFTNGCFDILHQGHVTYLQEARKNCDRLIVGLNADSSVQILKGPERPIHDEDSRAIVLGGLECVDAVVLFGAEKQGDDNTASKLIEYLKPDIYFKGGDYKVEDIPETPTVQSYGGEVRVMIEVKGHSTTGSLAKMHGEAA
ncbi:D-glycero-beta-D-manno-heptose-7-phosphate kinase [Alphaproteobacteria bacterium]|nr:D-glycero-beta-D-manno-heptose-7-phosphate kinase [Alphaproteobacteria bacterium]